MGTVGSKSSQSSSVRNNVTDTIYAELIDTKWTLPSDCEDAMWTAFKLSSVVGSDPSDLGSNFSNEWRAKRTHEIRTCSLGFASAYISSDTNGDDQLEGALCLSMSSLQKAEMSSLVTQAKQDLLQQLSRLCEQEDVFHQAVKERVHAMHCIHAAMTRKRNSNEWRACSAREKYWDKGTEQNSLATPGRLDRLKAPGDAILGLRLLFSMLDLVQDPGWSREQRADFLYQISSVLSNLPPLCLTEHHLGLSHHEDEIDDGQSTPTPNVVHALLGFLVTCIHENSSNSAVRQLEEDGIDQHGHTARLSSQNQREIALSALTSLVTARGRASDLLVLVKVLLEQHVEGVDRRLQRGNGASAPQDGTERGETHILMEWSTKRPPTSRVKTRTSRQGLPLDDYRNGTSPDDENSNEETESSLIVTSPVTVEVGPPDPATGANVLTNMWRSKTAPQKLVVRGGSKPLEAVSMKAKKRKGERTKSSPTADHEPWQSFEGNIKDSSSTEERTRSGSEGDERQYIEAHCILPFLRQLQRAQPERFWSPKSLNPAYQREVWTCGQNSYGELGHNDTGTRKNLCLVKMFKGKDVTDIAAGNEHSVLLCRTGEVYAAGYNDNGQCGQATTQRVGVLTRVEIASGNKAVQVHAYNGCEHTLVVLEDGQVVSFGYNYRGQLGHGNTTSEPVPKPLRGLVGARVAHVSCSYYHSIIACVSGEVYTFGRNDFGQLGTGDTIDRKLPSVVEYLRGQRATNLACGQYHTVISTMEVGIQSCGKNDYGQLGIESADFQQSFLPVKGALEGVTIRHLCCGYYHTVVVTARRQVLAFGRNDYGQLGLGHVTQRIFVPKIVIGTEGKAISRVSAGCYHTVLIASDGMLYVFGRNHHGQLGTGDTIERHSPFPIDTFQGRCVAKVAAGFYHTIVLTGGEEEDVKDLGSRESAQPLSAESILSQPGFILPREHDIAAEPTRTKELSTDEGHRIVSPEISSPTRDRGGNGHSHVLHHQSRMSEFAHDDAEADTFLEEAQEGICTARGRIDCVKAATIIVAHMDRLAGPWLQQTAVFSTVSTNRGKVLDDPHWIGQHKRCGESYTGGIRRSPYCIDVCPATFQLLSSILALVSEEKYASLSILDFTSQTYIILAVLRILKANLSRLLESPISSSILAGMVATGKQEDAHDDDENQSEDGLNHDLSVDKMLFDLSPNTLPVRPANDGGAVAVSNDRRIGCGQASNDQENIDKLKAHDARTVKHYRYALRASQRVLLSLIHFESPTVKNSDERVRKEAAEVLILGIEPFFPSQAEKLQLLSMFMDAAAANEHDEVDRVEDRHGAVSRTNPSPLASRHYMLNALLRQLSDDALASKLIPYGADEGRQRSVCTAVERSEPGLNGYQSLGVSTQALEKQVTLLVQGIGKASPWKIYSRDETPEYSPSGTPINRRLEASPSYMTQLNGSAMNLKESFDIDVEGAGTADVGDQEKQCYTRVLLVELLVSLTKHILHWGGSERIIVDPYLWRTRVLGIDGGVEQHIICRDHGRGKIASMPGWLVAHVKGLCDRPLAVVLDGKNCTPSSWGLLIRYAELVLKSAIVILEATLLEDGDKVDTRGGHDRKLVDVGRIDELQETLVGAVLPAIVNGLLPFTHLPLFARRLLRVVASTLQLLDRVCDRCPEIRQADAEYVAARNGRRAKEKPHLFFTRGENGKLGAGGARSCNNHGSPASTSAATSTKVFKDGLPWLLSLTKTTGLLAGRLAATLVVGDCGISQFLEPYFSSPVYSCWLRSDLFAGGCHPSYEIAAVTSMNEVDDDTGFFPEHLSTLPSKGRATAAGLSFWSDMLPSPEQIAHFSEEVTSGFGQGGIFASWLCETVRLSDVGYRMLKGQVSTTRDGCVLERVERGMLAALLKHASLENDAMLFSERRTNHSSAERDSVQLGILPKRFRILWEHIAKMTGWLWHARSGLKSADVEQVRVDDLFEEAFDCCTSLLLFNPMGHVPCALMNHVTANSPVARRRWYRALFLIRATIRWRSLVSHLRHRHVISMVPQFVRAMVEGRACPERRPKLPEGHNTIDLEGSGRCLQVMLLLVLHNYQRALTRASGFRAFHALTEAVQTPSLLADVLLPLPHALRAPCLVEGHHLNHLNAVGDSVTDRITRAFQGLQSVLLRHLEKSCWSMKKMALVTSSTGAKTSKVRAPEPAQANELKEADTPVFDFRLVLALIAIWGITIRAEDWEFVEQKDVIGHIAMAAATYDVDESCLMDARSRSSGNRHIDAAIDREPFGSNVCALRSHADMSEQEKGALTTCRAAAWTLFRALIIQLYDIDSLTPSTSIFCKTKRPLSSIIDVLHAELTKYVSQAKLDALITRDGAEHDAHSSSRGHDMPSTKAILEFASPRIGSFSDSFPHKHERIVSRNGGPASGMSHKRRCQELISSPRRLINMEDGIMFPAEHILSNMRSSDFSITFWLLLVQDYTGYHRTILARGQRSERWPVLLLRDSDNRLEVCFGIPGMVNLCERLTSKEAVLVNRWTHVGLISEQNKLRLYINGALDCQRTCTGALRAIRHPLYVGKVPDGAVRLEGVRGGVEGSIAHLRYFTRGLSPIHVRIICDPGPPETDKVRDRHLYHICAYLVVISRSERCRLHLREIRWLHLLLQAFMYGTIRVQQTICRLLAEILPLVSPLTMAEIKLGGNITPLALPLAREQSNEDVLLKTSFVDYLLRLVGACAWHVRVIVPDDADEDATRRGKEEEQEHHGLNVKKMLLQGLAAQFLPQTFTCFCSGSFVDVKSLRAQNYRSMTNGKDGLGPSNCAARHPPTDFCPELSPDMHTIKAELIDLVRTLAMKELWSTAIAMSLKCNVAFLMDYIHGTGDFVSPHKSSQRDVVHGSLTIEHRLALAGGEAALEVIGGHVESIRRGVCARVRGTDETCVVLNVDRAASMVHVAVHPAQEMATRSWLQRYSIHDLKTQENECLTRGIMRAFSRKHAAIYQHEDVCGYEYVLRVVAAFLRASPLPRAGTHTSSGSIRDRQTIYREILLAQCRSRVARIVLHASREDDWVQNAVHDEHLVSELCRVSMLLSATSTRMVNTEDLVDNDTVDTHYRIQQMLGAQGSGDVVASTIGRVATKNGIYPVVGQSAIHGGENEERQPSLDSCVHPWLGSLRCTLCQESMGSVSGIVEHVLSKHSGDMRRVPCPVCVAEKGDSSPHDLAMHVELLHFDAVLQDRHAFLPAIAAQRTGEGTAEHEEPTPPPDLVEQLMVIGFPRDWCTMALRENNNDVVNASAWIVDNLDMLSNINNLEHPSVLFGGVGPASFRANMDGSETMHQEQHHDEPGEAIGGQQIVCVVDSRSTEEYDEDSAEENHGPKDENDEEEYTLCDRENDGISDEADEDNDEEGDDEDDELGDEKVDIEEREVDQSIKRSQEEEYLGREEHDLQNYEQQNLGYHGESNGVPQSRALHRPCGERQLRKSHSSWDSPVALNQAECFFPLEGRERVTMNMTINSPLRHENSTATSEISGMGLGQLTEAWLHSELVLTILYCRAALMNIVLRWPAHVPMKIASFGSSSGVVKLMRSVVFSGQKLPITVQDGNHSSHLLSPLSNGAHSLDILGVFTPFLVHFLKSERDERMSLPTAITRVHRAKEAGLQTTVESTSKKKSARRKKPEACDSLSARLVAACLNELDGAITTTGYGTSEHRRKSFGTPKLGLLQWLLDLLLSSECTDIFTDNAFSRLSNCLSSTNPAGKEVAMYALSSITTKWCEHVEAMIAKHDDEADTVLPASTSVPLPSPLAMEDTFQRHMAMSRVRSALIKRIAIERRPGGFFLTRYTQTMAALYVSACRLRRLLMVWRQHKGKNTPNDVYPTDFAELGPPSVIYRSDSSVALTWLPPRRATPPSYLLYEVQMASKQLGATGCQDTFRCIYVGKRLRCRVDDLMPGQIYHFRVRAVFTDTNATPWSTIISAETEQGIAFHFDSCNSGPSIFVSRDELSATFGSNETWSTILGTTPFMAGNNYWELRLDSSSTAYLFIGVATREADLTTFLGGDDHGWGFIGDRALYHKRTKVKAYGERFGLGDTIGVTLNMDRGTLSFSKNGNDLGVAFDGLVGDLYPAVAFYNQGQRLTLVQSAFRCPGAGVTILNSPLSTSPEEVCEIHLVMDAMVSGKRLPPKWLSNARSWHSAWLAGSTVRYMTNLGFEMQYDISDVACRRFGLKAKARVRTSRGHATAIGVHDGVMWFHVDGERGAWFCTMGEMWEGRATGSFTAPSSGVCDDDRNHAALRWEAIMDGKYERNENTRRPSDGIHVGEESTSGVIPSAMLVREFATVGDCAKWTPAIDSCIVKELCDGEDRLQVSVWNFSPAEVLKILAPIRRRLGALLKKGQGNAEDVIVSDCELLCRVSLLKHFNHQVVGVLPFADLAGGVQISGQAETRTFCWGAPTAPRGLGVAVTNNPTRGLGPLFVHLRRSLFRSTKRQMLSQAVCITMTPTKKAEDEYDYPDDLPQVTINRLRAVVGQESPNLETRLQASIIYQLYRELHPVDTAQLRLGYTHPMDNGQRRTFKVKFEGEGVDDYGGPYREVFTQVAAELTAIAPSASPTRHKEGIDPDSGQHTCLLPFLQPSPASPSGTDSDAEAEFVIATNVSPHRFLSMYRFLGQLLGIALRCQVTTPWRLSRLFWKGLVGEAFQEQDLAKVDPSLNAFVQDLHSQIARCGRPPGRESGDGHAVEANGILASIAEYDLTWTAPNREGTMELTSRGDKLLAKPSDSQTHLQEMVQAQIHKGDTALFAVRDGLASVLPTAVLPIFTWEEMEMLSCGQPGVDIDLLQANTEYDDDLSISDSHIQSFWRVLRSFDDRDRSQFLRFVWARSRLPTKPEDFHQKFKIHSPTSDGAKKNPDQYLPKAHTCFFSINLPKYSSDVIMAEKITYTMYNCIEMDADFRLAENEISGWITDSANSHRSNVNRGDRIEH